MKAFKLAYILPVLILAGLVTSCSEDTKDVSIVVNYPDFEMQGDQYMFLLTGETYQEPGVKAYVVGEETDVTVSGTVDTSTPGVYIISYNAGITEPLEAYVSIDRYVLVSDTPPNTSGHLEGRYELPKNHTYYTTMQITYLGAGMYRASNVWYQSSPAPIIFVDNGDGEIFVPRTALSGWGPISGNGLSSYTLDPIVITFRMNFENYGRLENLIWSAY